MVLNAPFAANISIYRMSWKSMWLKNTVANPKTHTCNKVDDEPSSYIKEENRQLKNNFERLNTLFQESLEEVDRVKSEYTAMLV